MNLTEITAFEDHSAILKEIWVDRDNGLINKAYEAFMRLAIRLNYPLHANSVAEKLKKSQNDVSLVMLDISFKRSGLKTHEALREALELDAELTKLKIPRDGFYYRQMGLFHMGVSSYSKAFDEFIKVKKANSDRRNYISGFLSTILCMQALGYDYQEYLAEFEQESQDILDKPEYFSLRHQYEYMKLISRSLGEGDFSFLDDATPENQFSGQARYLALWLSELPYLGNSTGSAKDLERAYIQDGVHWLNGFRLRTINELLTREDLEQGVRIDAQIDRLYLWTWRWLMDPTSARIARIREVLNTIAQNKTMQQITVLDRQLLENALGWLSFYQGVEAAWYEPLLSCLSSSPRKGSDLLIYERQVQDYLRVRRDGNIILGGDLLEQLQQSPVHRLPQMRMWSRIENLVILKKEKPREGVLVEGPQKKVTFYKNFKAVETLESASLSKFFYLFSKKNRYKKEELLKWCFHFNFYSPEDHNVKISNLVARANRLVGARAIFKTKGDEVFLSDDLPIQADGISLHSLQAEFLNDLNLKPTPSGRRQPGQELEKKWLKRSQLEQALAVSKTTATRRLKEWIRAKKVKVRGQGKNTEYFILASMEDLLEELTNEI